MIKATLPLIPALAALAFFHIIDCAALPPPKDGFSAAKQILETMVYAAPEHRKTLYCGAEFDAQKNIRLPEGFTTPAHAGRAERMEWEHAVPAENFGRAFVEWREGAPQCVKDGQPYKGRKCAAKMSREYRRMEADMHNLFPSIGAVNAVRSNRRYAELPGERSAFGSCPAKVTANGFEPPDRAKGIVARDALYMDARYPHYHLSAAQKRLFSAWDNKHPVDEWECQRAWLIERLQGNDNVFVKNPCLKAGWWPGK